MLMFVKNFLNKCKEYCLNTNWYLIMFIGMSLRAIVFGASLSDALALLPIAGIACYKLFIIQTKVTPVNEAFAREFLQIKSKVDNLQARDNVKTMAPSEPIQPKRYF